MRNRKTLKTLRYSESFNFFCFGAKSKLFSRIFVSVSVKSFQLSLSTLSHTKLPDKLQCSIRTDRTLIWDLILARSPGNWRSLRMLRTSLLYPSRQTWYLQPLPIMILIAFLDVDVSVQIGGGKLNHGAELYCSLF